MSIPVTRTSQPQKNWPLSKSIMARVSASSPVEQPTDATLREFSPDRARRSFKAGSTWLAKTSSWGCSRKK